MAVAALDDFYIMVGTGHNGFLLPVVDFGQKKNRKPFLISCLVGGWYSILKV